MALSVEEFAEKCSASKTSIFLWESGHRPPSAKYIEIIERLYSVYKVQNQDNLFSANDKDFPEKLRKFRNERKLSQQDLAKAVGVAQNVISHWETGEIQPSVAKLKALRKFQKQDYKGDGLDTFLENFQEKLINLREHLGLTALEFSKAVGIPDVTMQHWLYGNKNPSTASIRKIEAFCTKRDIDFNTLKAARKKHLNVSSKDIRKFRDEFGLTQAQFAGIVKSSEITVDNWESGRKPSLRYQRKLSKVMASRSTIWKALHRKLYFIIDKNLVPELGESASLIGEWLNGKAFPTQTELAAIDRLCARFGLGKEKEA